jgi:hypothetical protein
VISKEAGVAVSAWGKATWDLTERRSSAWGWHTCLGVDGMSLKSQDRYGMFDFVLMLLGKSLYFLVLILRGLLSKYKGSLVSQVKRPLHINAADVTQLAGWKFLSSPCWSGFKDFARPCSETESQKER